MKSILFPVGIEGHIPLAAAFRKEFGLPVTAIVLSQAVEKVVEGWPDRLYSFPRFYKKYIDDIKKMSSTELRDQIVLYENKFGIDACSTYFYFDRDLRRETNYVLSLQYICLYLKFVEYILDQEDPAWCKGNLTTFFGAALNAACVAKSIPCLKHSASRVTGRIDFMDGSGNGLQRGWRRSFEKELASDKTRVEALSWLDTFRSQPARPAYAEKNSVASFDAGRMFRTILQALRVRFTSSYWRSVFAYPLDRQLHHRAPFGEALIKDFFLRECRAARLRHSFNNTDLDDRFLYLPLQYTPEISTLYHGLQYENQGALVESVAKFLPSDLRLFVKEHTSMVGRRKLEFYRNINRYFNVHLVSPAINTFDLIIKSQGVITVTGTAGWEAFIFGKPVISLGHVFYNEFPGVLSLDLGEDFARRVGKYLTQFRPDEDAIQRAVVAFFDTTYPATTGDIGIDTQRSRAKENAEIVAHAYADQLQRF